jgi:hypothetical protein
MKKILLATITVTVMALMGPDPSRAGVDIGISLSLPPLVVFAAPPEMVVIPETNVYVVPDVDVDVYFNQGWWWRPWQGRWYRSRHYDSGWSHYRQVPHFYRSVPSGWRNDFREKRWQGREWRYQRLPPQDVRRNWRTWEKSKHWEKQNHWGVPDLRRQQPSRQQSGEVKGQHAQPQNREAPQRAKSQQGRHGKEKDEKQDGK